MAYDAEGWNGGQPEDPVVKVELLVACLVVVGMAKDFVAAPGATVDVGPIHWHCSITCMRLTFKSGDQACRAFEHVCSPGDLVRVNFQ